MPKFIRYAQFCIDSTGTGILGFITNNTYIDGITHRQMRSSLLSSFDMIHILDLHGSSKKKEKCPDGSKDENVFDITQGVGIGIFVKSCRGNAHTPTHSGDLWGLRINKYKQLLESSLGQAGWPLVAPEPEYYFFVAKDFTVRAEYSQGWCLDSIFPANQSGIQTDRDKLFLDFDRDTIENRIETFYSDEGLKAPFKVEYRVENSSSYNILSRRRNTSFDASNVRRCAYRPFDFRWMYYNPSLTSRAAWDVMGHMVAGENYALIGMRQFEYDVPEYCYAFVTDTIAERRVFISNRGAASIFPLYIFDIDNKKGEYTFAQIHTRNTGDREKRPNISKEFTTAFTNQMKLEFVPDSHGDLENSFGPEDVFHYIYAILHSPTYRKRYAEFLKIDFPRIPIASNRALSRNLCTLGQRLLVSHLMKDNRADESIASFPVQGDNRIASVNKNIALVEPMGTRGKIFINTTQYFDSVPEEVWNFHIGGYQVCYKWLADRKKAGRKLSQEDIDHYQKIIVAINETIKIMKQIDETIEAHGGWPIK